MDKTTKAAEPETPVPPAPETANYAASWDVFYQDAQGLECHLQLRGTSVGDLLELARGTSVAITEAGGKPSRRMAGRSTEAEKPKENGNGSGNGSSSNGSFREPTYVDERGTRRCNRKLTDGSVCGRPVTEKEGRYGNFWSCPNYKAHAPVPAPAR